MTRDWKNPNAVLNVADEGVFTGDESQVTNHGSLTSHQSPIASHHFPCLVVDLGLIAYADAYALQTRLVAALKASTNPASPFTSHQSPVTSHVLLLCEHPHVITMGRNGKREHLLASDRVLQQKGVEFHATDRGGDITYHGPGQIVGYPILNLAAIRRDVGWYVRMLEETMIRATTDYGVTAVREPGKTGIWVSATSGAPEKLGAIGVHLSRWVTSHGFAYNVSTDLRYFDLIVPCGIADRKATSLEKLLGRRIDQQEAAARLTKHFAEIFGLTTTRVSRADLLERLEHIEQPAAVSA